MSYTGKIKSILISFALLLQLTNIETKASSLEGIPSDVVRVSVCKYLHIHDIVSLSQTSKTMRRTILNSDNGKTTISNSLGKLYINIHNGEFDDETLAQKGFIHYRSDEELPASIPEAGSKHYLWGILIGLYKSVPLAHYAKFSNCTNIGLAGLDKLANDDLKFFFNAVAVDLNGCWNITDEGIEHLKNARVLYLDGCMVTYKGLCQLAHLRVVYKFSYGLYKPADEEQLQYQKILKERGVRICR